MYTREKNNGIGRDKNGIKCNRARDLFFFVNTNKKKNQSKNKTHLLFAGHERGLAVQLFVSRRAELKPIAERRHGGRSDKMDVFCGEILVAFEEKKVDFTLVVKHLPIR